MTNSVTKEIAIEIVGDLGMTHFPFDFSDFRAGRPGTTSVQNGTNLRGLQFLEIEEQQMNRSTAAALHHNQIFLFNSLSNQSNKKMANGTFVWLNVYSLGFIDGVQSVDISGSITPNPTMLLIKSIRRKQSFQSQDEN
jgi:hypothetical protein